MAKEAKTTAMRMLDRQKVKYEAFTYECDEFIDGLHSADLIGAPYDQSFKTLVMEGKSGGCYVFFGAFAAFYSSGVPLSCVQEYQNTRDRPRKTCTG